MSSIPYEDWEPVIGLEIHVQLNTKSKLFSSAPNHFGDEPNVNITDVCTGQPGTLPVLNQEAVRKAVQFGCAIHANVAHFSTFDRKSYFYPDSPRNFQITQFDQPIILGGSIVAEVHGQTKHFSVNRAHIEDDSGMLKHFSTFAGVDYNRAGTPLLEIVSEACMHSPKEASAYAQAVKAIMQYLDASDCNMEEGSLRVDCNVSVKRKGETRLRNKTEIKNLNSFHYMELAIESEIRRQIRLYTEHPHEDPYTLFKSGTYRFDSDTGTTVLMRQKEEAADYRYFPEPDLPPIILTESYIQEIKTSLPELPHQKFKRYLTELLIPIGGAIILVNEKALAEYFEEALKTCSNAKNLSNWITVEFAGRFKESGKTILQSGITASHVAKLVNLIDQGIITGKIAKSIADDMVLHPTKDPEQIVRENPDYLPVHNTSEIEPLVAQVLAENAQSVIDFKAGKEKAFAFLVGQVMKLSKGKASPSVVNEILRNRLRE